MDVLKENFLLSWRILLSLLEYGVSGRFAGFSTRNVNEQRVRGVSESRNWSRLVDVEGKKVSRIADYAEVSLMCRRMWEWSRMGVWPTALVPSQWVLPFRPELVVLTTP